MNIKHDYPFDPTSGMTEKDLLAIPPPSIPEGFEEFWRNLYKETTAEECRYTVEEELWSPEKDTRIYRISFTHDNGIRIGAWVTVPKTFTSAILVGHGYGHVPTARDALRKGFLTIHPCLRGLGLSQQKDIPWEVEHHALYGIHSPETYVLTGCVKDFWMAAGVLLKMFPEVKGKLHYDGISLGGGLGMLLLPWDDRIGASAIDIPTLAGQYQFNFPARSGSLSEIRKKYALAHPEVKEVFTLFDAASAAGFLRKKVLITPALFDPVNPPPVQFIIANSIPEEYRILRIRETGHFTPTEKDLLQEKELEELKEKLFTDEVVG